MTLKYSSTRILHDDHMATIALMAELERVVLSRQAAPAEKDAEVGRFIDRLCRTMKGEITGHFDYEEVSVFPRLAEYGMADLGELLIEEHHALRSVMNDAVAGADAARAGGFSPETWKTFRRLCGEFVERLTSHIEKEERSLLPAMEDSLTPEMDTELAACHDLES